jgi:hypothetical protein
MTPAHADAAVDRLLGANEVLVADAVVTPDEQSVLVDWAEQQRTRGALLSNPRDPHVYSTHYRSAAGELTRFTKRGPAAPEDGEQRFVWVPGVDEPAADAFPEEFWRVRSRAIDLAGLHFLEEDPYKGAFLSYVAIGGAVHEHRDAMVRVDGEDCHILRCNVLFKRPEQGGMPVIEGKEIEIADRGMWVFYATALVHAATAVAGRQFRGLLSFGFVVRHSDLWRRRFRLSAKSGLGADPNVGRHFIASLRQGPHAATLGEERLSLLEFVVLREGDFTVEEAARELARDPSATSDLLRDLQRSNLVESYSSLDPRAGVRVF